ncbi:MAG TPA: response regulator transcription factor [Erysipelotrichaceae bacterium]|nr:response regulator transcription factor [Erysipelotrichaceae bacterium]
MKDKNTILIADDNPQITSILASYCKKEGYETVIAVDGFDALNKLTPDVDLVLLDVMMPKLDGFSVCKEIRKDNNVPVIMVTARGEDFEKIMGLDIGADDYIVKPFSPLEVMARIKAVLRRLDPGSAKHLLKLHNLLIDMRAYRVEIEDEEVSLTRKEIELLFTLSNHPNIAFSRDQLLNQVWGYDYYGDSRTVDSHMTRLRSKLDHYKHPLWDLKTVWGVGYKFETTEEKV